MSPEKLSVQKNVCLLVISEYSTVKHWSVVCISNFVLEKPIKKINKSPFDSHIEETELEGKMMVNVAKL